MSMRVCSPSQRLRLGVLVSGGGSNLQALLDRCAWDSSALAVSTVVSNVNGVRALDRAREHNVNSAVFEHAHRTREAFEGDVHAHLLAHAVEVVVLAGFMRILTAGFIARFPGRIVNVHPALLPSFPGTHAARQALAAGVKLTGCTVHIVDAGVDTGRILAQASVPVYAGDDEPRLQARIQIQEHRLLPEVLEAVARGEIDLDTRE